MPLRNCTVVIHDLNETAHSLDVTAETLYEAIAQALAVLSHYDWVDEIGKGFTTVTVTNPTSRGDTHREDPGF